MLTVLILYFSFREICTEHGMSHNSGHILGAGAQQSYIFIAPHLGACNVLSSFDDSSIKQKLAWPKLGNKSPV